MRGLVEIKIGGKKRPLKFGTNASALMGDELGLNYQELQEKFVQDKEGDLVNMTMMDMRAFFWSSLVAGAKTKGKESDFGIDTVGDWLDEIDPIEMAKAFQANKASSPQGDKKKAKAA